MKDCHKKAKEGGRAFDTHLQFDEVKEFIVKEIKFLGEYFGEGWVASTAEEWALALRNSGSVAYKSDISMSIAVTIPRWLIYAYKKILVDFRKELNDTGGKDN